MSGFIKRSRSTLDDIRRDKLESSFQSLHLESISLHDRGYTPLLLKLIHIPILLSFNELKLLEDKEREDKEDEIIESIEQVFIKVWIAKAARRSAVSPTDIKLIKGIASDATNALCTCLFKEHSIKAFTDYSNELKLNRFRHIPFLQDYQIDETQIAEIIDFTLTLESTLTELNFRISKLTQNLIQHGIKLTHSELAQVESHMIIDHIDRSVLIGTINEYLNSIQANNANNECTRTEIQIYIEHKNCNYADQAIGTPQLVEISEYSFLDENVCKVDVDSIDEESWHDSLTNKELENNKSSEYILPYSYTTSLITTLKPTFESERHSMYHPYNFNTKSAVRIVTGPECTIYIKEVKLECGITPSFPKLRDEMEDQVDKWYGLIMSIDKLFTKYEPVMNNLETASFENHRLKIESYLRVWDQAKTNK